MRTERERKSRRKDRLKQAVPEESPATATQNLQAWRADTDGASTRQDSNGGLPGEEEEKDPFDDPFFTEPASAAKEAKKASRKAKSLEKALHTSTQDQSASSERANLELLMAEDGDDGVGRRHFNMAEVYRAEKDTKKRKKIPKLTVPQDDFQLDLSDIRFNALYHNHEYTIDPTNKKFKSTKAMQSLLHDVRENRERKHGRDKQAGEGSGISKKQKRLLQNHANENSIDGMLERIRRRTGTV